MGVSEKATGKQGHDPATDHQGAVDSGIFGATRLLDLFLQPGKQHESRSQGEQLDVKNRITESLGWIGQQERQPRKEYQHREPPVQWQVGAKSVEFDSWHHTEKPQSQHEIDANHKSHCQRMQG